MVLTHHRPLSPAAWAPISALMWQLYALAPGTASSTHRICHMPPLSTAAYVSILFYNRPCPHNHTHIVPTDTSTQRRRTLWWLIGLQTGANLCCDCCSTVREGGEGRAEMVVRVQAQDQSWVWLYMVLQLQPGEIPISSNNYIIRYSQQDTHPLQVRLIQIS